MAILKSFLALLAGFATMELLIAITTAILMRGSKSWAGTSGRATPTFVTVSLGYMLLSAAGGGYITAWMAVNRPLHTVLTLAIVVLAFGAVTMLQMRGTRPLRYQVALLMVSTLGVMAGGLLRLKTAGLL